MKYWSKITGLYYTFLAVFAGFIIGYSLFNWYFVIQPNSKIISEDISNFWLPFVLSMVVIFFVFKWKVKPKKVNVGSLILISLMSGYCINPAAIIAQYYLSSVGKIIHLDNINQIKKYPNSKYYTLKYHSINKSFAGIYSIETVASRSSYDYEIIMACPILENQSDTLKDHFNAWLIKSYYKNFGGFDDDDIQQRETAFWEESIKDFKKANLNKFIYLKTADFDDKLKNYKKATENSVKYFPSKENVVFLAYNQPYEDRNNSKFFWLIFSTIIGPIVFYLALYYVIRLMVE